EDTASILQRYGVSTDVRLVLLGAATAPRELWILRRDSFDRNVRYPLALRQTLRRMPAPDLLYGRHIYSMMFASLAWPAVPMIFELHQVRSNRGGRLAERWLFQRPAFI